MVSKCNVIITFIITYVQKLLSFAFFSFSSGGHHATRGSVKVETSSFLLVSIEFTVALTALPDYPPNTSHNSHNFPQTP